MEINAQVWITLGLAFLAGALKLAIDRPLLLEDWGRKINNFLYFLVLLVAGASFALIWTRSIISAQMDAVLTEEHLQALGWVRDSLSDASRSVTIVLAAAAAVLFFVSALEWFGRAWRKSAMPVPPRESGQQPGRDPDVHQERKDPSADSTESKPK